MGGIEIKCQGATTVGIDDLIHFQGNLKSLDEENYHKLKLQILELGFCEPVSIWDSPDGFLIANGHQRLRTLSVMAKEGFEIPPIPVNFIFPSSMEEFTRIVLSLCSQYGKVEKDGLYEYCAKHSIPVEYLEKRLRLPELDVPKFKQEYYVDMVPNLSKRHCPHCGGQFEG
jgi:hypothetical protein